MKVRVIKTPSFAAGGLYDSGYQLSPGETQAMIQGYTNAAKSVAGAAKSFGSAAMPVAALTHDALNDPNQTLIKTALSVAGGPAGSMASSALGSMGSAAGAAGAAGTGAAAAGATGAAAGAAGAAASIAPLAALASDKRVKENIERVGETYDGQNIYRFNYKGDPHTQLGLIAQEVEKTDKDSVYNVNGIKMVDYNSATEDAAQKGKFMNGGNYRKKLSKTMTYAEGGTTTDPQLLAAYRSIANELANGQDPNALVGQFVDSGMNYDDAQEIVSQVMDFMNPTSEEQMPQAQMGGGMNAGMFAGQSTEPSNIIEKPIMRDGGQTFVTSQNAYTQKSHNYFGTSNAPARDSYTDNDEITTSVKAVPREDATIEAEKGEYIFSEQGLYKIEGKKHSKGGTPLAARGGEFIFSAHKDMSIDPQLQKEAGLKKHSSKSLADNTPAKVLERNIDVKEYNRLKAIVDNPKSDVVTKKTAQFMLEKMDSKIQVIAKLQEANKQPDPVEIKDQYLEQPQVQDEINEQKQFAYGGQNLPMYETAGPTMDPKRAAAISNAVNTTYAPWYNTNTTPATTTTTQPATQTKPVAPATNNPESLVFDPATSEAQRLNELSGDNYNVTYSPRIASGNLKVPAMQPKEKSGLYGDVQTSELGEFKNRHKWYFDKNPNWNAANPENVKDFQTKYDQEYAKQFGFSYFPGNRKFNAIDSMFGEYTFNAPGLMLNKNVEPAKTPDTTPTPTTTPNTTPTEKSSETTVTTETTPQGMSTTEKTETTPEKVYTGTEYDNVLKDPYDKIRAMQASQYLNNVIANKPYFTYAAPVNAPLTEAQKMSYQPFLDEAAKARYSANQLASKFGDSTQRMIAAAQQNDAVNKAGFEIGKYNTEAETQNRNQNLLRDSARTNTWNDRLKQAYDQNTNVLDKMNFANAAYYNQSSKARQEDILGKYYADRDLQTAYIPYLDTYDVQNPNGTWTKRVAAPTYLNGQPNPNWSGYGSSAVNKMALKQNNNSLKTTIQALKEEGFDQDQIIKILGRQKLDE